MENHFVVSMNGPWYDLFYNLAFLVTLVILIYEGVKRRFPLLKWLFLLIITRFLFIVGTKVFTFSFEEWKLMITQFELAPTTKKSLIGGIIFGSIGLFAGYYLLQFRRNILDAFAFIFPVGIAIQRMGCFFAGCCYGKVSELPWAVSYPVQTLPHYHQFNDHLIGYSDLLSLPVHPVQLYELGGMLLVIATLFYLRKRLQKPGSMFLASFILVFLVRFADEFFRDAQAHTVGGRMIGIFNTTQIFLIPVILILLFILIERERSVSEIRQRIAVPDLNLKPAFTLVFFFSVSFLLFKDWLTFSEKAVISCILLVMVSVISYRLISQVYLSPHRWVYLAGLVFPLFLMAQTFPYEQDSVTIKKYTTLKIGVSNGNFDNSHNIGRGEGCDRVSNTEYFEQKYTTVSSDLEFTQENIDRNFSYHYGVQMMLGSHKELRVSDGYTKNTTLFGLSPYGKFDSKWLGVGAGFHVGSLEYIGENLSVDGSGIPTTGSPKANIYPRFYFRAGPSRWFFVDYHFADNFPYALPGYRKQIGVGSGFGLKNGTLLRFGTNNAEQKYLSGYFPIRNKIVVEPVFFWGPSVIDNQTQFQFAVGLGYRFGFEEVKSPKKF